MSSFMDPFTPLTKSVVSENTIPQVSASSTIRRRRECHRRKFIDIPRIKLDELQKQIQEADNEGTYELPEKFIAAQSDKENVPDVQPLQDSFDLNFGTLSLNTPAKKPEVLKTANFATPCIENKAVAPKNGQCDFVTPSNKTSTKVQWSVKMQPYNRTPITKLYPAPQPTKTADKPKTIDLPRPWDWKKVKVNDVVYIVCNELGKGGSSEVFHCFNPEAKVHRAIKVVSLENSASAVGFINEVKLLKTLQKCNRIIKMFDFEIKQEEKILLVVLEVGGTDLSKILKESAANAAHMPLYMLLYYWMEMLYAVKQIHSNGIIHSDLKPANFLKVEGYLKLIDFGIASCVQNDMTSVVKSVPEGSFNYISPEALCNDSSSNNNSPSYGKPKYKIHFKSDVWSLGCILYQLVYRRTPFFHITQPWMKLATIVDPNHKIEYLEATWVPQKIIDTIKCCLQFNMKLRPSIDDLILEYESMFHSLS